VKAPTVLEATALVLCVCLAATLGQDAQVASAAFHHCAYRSAALVSPGRTTC
jgi:hypothetical protein